MNTCASLHLALEAIEAFAGDDLDITPYLCRFEGTVDAAHDARVREAVSHTMDHPYDGWLRALGRDDVPGQGECAHAYLHARSVRGVSAKRTALAHFLMLCSAYSAAPILLHDVADEFDLVGSYLSSGTIFASMVLRSIEARQPRARRGFIARLRTRDVTMEELREMARGAPEFEVYRRTRRSALEDLLEVLLAT